MASIALGVVGTAVGGPLGGAVGGLVGGIIDTVIGNMLTPAQKVKGPGISDIRVQTAQEGAPIPRVSGYDRVAGQVIWASNYRRNKHTSTQDGVKIVKFHYFIDFAVSICEGPIARLGRIWADGRLLDLNAQHVNMRFYNGSETQNIDPRIDEIESGNAPPYRGLAYVVFEQFFVTDDFSNRIPQLSFEVFGTDYMTTNGKMEKEARAVVFGTGSGEFTLSTEAIRSDDGEGDQQAENQTTAKSEADVLTVLDDLEALVPNVQKVCVQVNWYGDDLRCAECEVKPGVTDNSKETEPQGWQVSSVSRGSAYLVSTFASRPAYMGTPDDRAVWLALTRLKDRGYQVALMPVMAMDIAAGNTLPNPYSNGAATLGQPQYPHRKYVTCSPAAGFTGTVDKTATAATQIATFFGTAAPGDFGWEDDGERVSYSGPAEFSYRRFVLNYARIAQQVGIDAFIIGSALKGLTQVRSSATAYPTVTELIDLAADVRAMVGTACQIGYSADWSEWNNHRPDDGSDDVFYNLDPLYADAEIDFIGIENFMPLSDWRDGYDHTDYDATNGPWRLYDEDYLTSNIAGGEHYDWTYADDSARDAQTRTNITDVPTFKPWVFRQKDLVNWWENQHHNRPGGTESGSPTAWVPESKPIWFTKLGFPAVDKATNRPEVVYDPKSSEPQAPYYSSGERDDLIQRMAIEAHLAWWDDVANNPVSSVYSDSMVDPDSIFLHHFDARPWPFYPARNDLWSDTDSYYLGHHLNGRMGSIVLPDLVSEIVEYNGMTSADYDVLDLRGVIPGFKIDKPMAPRDAIEPLARALHFDVLETEGIIKFLMRGRPLAPGLSTNELVLLPDRTDIIELMRGPEVNLPNAFRVSYIEISNEYRMAAASAQRLAGSARRSVDATLPMVLDQGQAVAIGDRLLQEALIERERPVFRLPLSKIKYDPGDEITVNLAGYPRRMRIVKTGIGSSIEIDARMTDPGIYESYMGSRRTDLQIETVQVFGHPLAVLGDFPWLTTNSDPWEPYFAAYSNPWPGIVNLYRSGDEDGPWELVLENNRRATIGRLLDDLDPGPEFHWDLANTARIKIFGGDSLESASELEVLNGANLIAIQNDAGGWELLQFKTATFTDPQTWRISDLLRGRFGTEDSMESTLSTGNRVLVLDGDILQIPTELADYNLTFFHRFGPSQFAVDSDTYDDTVEREFTGRGLKPFSPVHVDLTAGPSANDLTIDWIRQDRAPSADSWEGTVPMSEATEAYEVDIYDGSVVVRTLDSTTTSVVYTAAQQVADFSSHQTSISVEVFQMSATVGRGTGREATISL